MAAWTKEQETIFREMWEAGEKVTVIAVTFGVSDSTVRWKVRTMGLQIRPPKEIAMTPEQLEVLVSMWRKGATESQIAKHLGISLHVVKSRILRTRAKFPFLVPRRNYTFRPSNEGNVTCEEVKSAVCKYYGLRHGRLESTSRKHKYSEPRQVAMALCRRIIGMSLPQIARQFGGRHHTTALLSIRRAQSKFPGKIAELEEKICNGKAAAKEQETHPGISSAERCAYGLGEGSRAA